MISDFTEHPKNGSGLNKLNWRGYEESVSGNSPFVVGDSVSSNDIIRMKGKN